jgi:hypothetical protein
MDSVFNMATAAIIALIPRPTTPLPGALLARWLNVLVKIPM